MMRFCLSSGCPMTRFCLSSGCPMTRFYLSSRCPMMRFYLSSGCPSSVETDRAPTNHPNLIPPNSSPLNHCS